MKKFTIEYEDARGDLTVVAFEGTRRSAQKHEAAIRAIAIESLRPKPDTIRVLEDHPKVAARAKTGRLLPCPGDAHLPEVGGRIDNCGICAPRWGLVDELGPLDLEVARAERMDVPFSACTDEQSEELLKLVAAGAARRIVRIVHASWGSSTSYGVRVLG